ncbi:Hypothetical Protein PD5205_02639 [Xanthomonas fragariae]|uniref:Uncharacterized protein n=1 Tax=Xanthomonas fragariae TaxID=48664 RepID=A0A1Y6HK81_9XANT|nr:hypothetical protein BER92_12750 [Xanthomonas fragariae]ENZ96857.1 hypothetical protein O1K_02761 [Xanthomonas fragariae LMG 25863]AOD18846.1 hypothetical protein BER93_12775 [Xanthomonas fragariae]MBL9196523.1 hypothetical protein [Xanthomonas fragariae]SMQ95967.1 Hypothetical Protein NBC2815_02640 [Xanthomonas fragariae]
MDATAHRYAYRYLSLAIAITHGWELLCQSGFQASQEGADGLDAIQISADARSVLPAIGHFGCGVLTLRSTTSTCGSFHGPVT